MKQALRIISVIAISFLMAGTALAADRYVSVAGSNLQDGSIGSPWQTIQYAVSNSTANDNIYVSAGTYNENVTITTALNLIGEDKSTTFIMGTGSHRVVSINNVSSPMRVSGFTINAVNCTAPRRGLQAASSSNVTIEDNNIIYYGDIGVWTLSNNIIRNNTIHCADASGSTFGNIYVSGANNTIENNTLTGFTSYGVYCYGGSTPTNQYNVIKKNTITANMATGSGYGVYLYNSGGNTIGGASAGDGNNVSLRPHTSELPCYAYGVKILTYPDGYVTSNTIQYNTFNGGNRIIEVEGFVGGTTTFSDNTIGNTAPPSHYGILVYGGNAVISNNIFLNVPGPIQFGRSGGIASMAISISGNSFQGGGSNVAAIFASYANSITANRNKFDLAAGAAAIVNSSSQNINASYNWWGHATGPYNSSYNPGGLGHSVNSNVTYVPFYTTAEMTTVIPTLGEWGLIAFAGLLLLVGGTILWKRLV